MVGNESRRWLRRTLIGAAALAVIAVAWTGRGDYTPADVGRMAPQYSAATLEGETIDTEELRGRAIVLNVWATWCRPCVKEMPALQRLYEQYRDEGLVVLAVSVDNAALVLGDPTTAVRTFAEDYRITFPILLDPERRIESGYPIGGLPMTYLIDRDGRIRARILGPREWDQPAMESEIRQLLEN